jgi:hypothetical protein
VRPGDSPRLLAGLRALGATVTPRDDGCDFVLGGATGTFVVGERSPDEPDDGSYTICRVPLAPGGPAFVMELRPQTMREQGNIARGDAIDVELGDPGFDRAFVVEAAPSAIVRAVLGETVRAARLALAPCHLACAAGHLKLSKAGVWIGERDIAGIVVVCLRVRDSLERLPEGVAHGGDATGYRGERVAPSGEDLARAADEIAEVHRVRRTRRQSTSANAGLIVLGVLVAAMLIELWRG